MRERVRYCIRCGKQFICKSSNALYCGKECKYESRDIVFQCPHNVAVFCDGKSSCSACGWNPEVAKRRMEAFA